MGWMTDRNSWWLALAAWLQSKEACVSHSHVCSWFTRWVSVLCHLDPIWHRALHPIPNQLSSSSASSIHHHLYEQMCGSRASELRCVDGYHPHGCWRCQLGQQRKGWCAACRWAQPKCTTRTGGMDRDGLQLEVIMDHDSQIVWAIN